MNSVVDLKDRKSICKMLDFTGKNVLVTGAAGQIGMMSAAAFAELGANVIVTDRQCMREKLAYNVNYMNEHFAGKHSFYTTDITVRENVCELMCWIEDNYGYLNAVHSNAGMAFDGDTGSMNIEVLDKTMNINVRAMLLVNMETAKLMKKYNIPGAIVNTASMSGFIVNRVPDEVAHQIAYPMSKAAVIQMTKALAADYAGSGIRVNCVSPGYVFSAAHNGSTEEMINYRISTVPTKRFATADEIVGAVVYLASGLASYTTGTNLVVDGGYSIW